MKILIADDEKNIAEGIAAILRSQEHYQCEIRLADNGMEALKIGEAFGPDLVITDIRMFHMDGLQLAEEFKKRGICQNIILISGYSHFEYAQKAIRMNIMDYLLKPIDKQQLLRLADQVWSSLPVNYAANSLTVPLEHPFFQLELDREEYPPSLKKAIAYIRKNYINDLSLQVLSDELMLHPNYLSSLINKQLRVNFSYLLDYIRLEKACTLLLTAPETRIAEISYLVGYNDERRLYHAFHKRLSCTPGDFRAQVQKETFITRKAKAALP